MSTFNARAIFSNVLTVISRVSSSQYAPAIKKTYLVPVDHVATIEGRLKLEPTKNNQSKYVRWAKDYEL